MGLVAPLLILWAVSSFSGRSQASAVAPAARRAPKRRPVAPKKRTPKAPKRRPVAPKKRARTVVRPPRPQSAIPRRRKKQSAIPKKKAPPVVTTSEVLTEIPGDIWVIVKQPTGYIQRVAQELLRFIWDSYGEGGTFVAMVRPRQIVGFKATQRPDGSEGVTVWRLKKGVKVNTDLLPSAEVFQRQMELRGVTPPGAEEPDERKPQQEPEPEPELERQPEPEVTPVVVVEPDEEDEEEPAVVVVETPEPEPEVELLTNLPVLMQGSSGDDVVTLQKALGIGGKLGFFGNMTAERVREFQAKNGLDVDGVVGPQTWTALLS